MIQIIERKNKHFQTLPVNRFILLKLHLLQLNLTGWQNAVSFYGSTTNHLDLGIWVGWLVGPRQHKFQHKHFV